MKERILLCTGVFLFFCQAVGAELPAEQNFNKGWEAHQQGDYESALEFFNEALELAPDSAKTYNALGLVYRNQNAPLDEVVWYFKSAIDIDPNYFEAYENLGTLYLRTNNFTQAEEYLKKALRIHPDVPNIQYTLAWVYLNGLSKPDEALYYCQEILKKGDIPQVHYGIGLAHAMKNEGALVLERVTLLREKGYNDLASQLEDIIRKGYTPQPVFSTIVQEVPQPLPVQPATQTQAAIPGGSMRVRLNGTM